MGHSQIVVVSENRGAKMISFGVQCLMVGVNLNYFSPSFHIEMFINYVQSYLRREFMVIHHYLGSGTMTHIDLRVCGEQRKGGREE